MSVIENDNKRPVDDNEYFRALYSDGTLGPVLTIDLMDTLPLL
jgi:hypothetical protein